MGDASIWAKFAFVIGHSGRLFDCMTWKRVARAVNAAFFSIPGISVKLAIHTNTRNEIVYSMSTTFFVRPRPILRIVHYAMLSIAKEMSVTL